MRRFRVTFTFARANVELLVHAVNDLSAVAKAGHELRCGSAYAANLIDEGGHLDIGLVPVQVRLDDPQIKDKQSAFELNSESAKRIVKRVAAKHSLFAKE